MKRLILGLGLSLACACTCLSGCELLDHEKRSKSHEVIHEHEHEEETDSVDAVESKPAKNFFKGTRLSGALSSEGRDVERNLGVP